MIIFIYISYLINILAHFSRIPAGPHTGALGFAQRLNDSRHNSVVVYYGAHSSGIDQSWSGREDVPLSYTARLGNKQNTGSH